MKIDIKDNLVKLFLSADRDKANSLIDKWGEEYGFENVLSDLLEPALLEFGELWSSQMNISLSQGYITAKIAEDTIKKVAGGLKEPPSEAKKGPVVIGNIEDDFHMLGRKLVITMLRTAGWQVHDLGNDVPPSTFVDTALETGARIIGASAMMQTTAINILRLREEIDKRGLKDKVQLAVGGAIFIARPELVQEVGADGTARNAIEAVGLMDDLLKTSQMAGELP